MTVTLHGITRGRISSSETIKREILFRDFGTMDRIRDVNLKETKDIMESLLNSLEPYASKYRKRREILFRRFDGGKPIKFKTYLRNILNV